MPRVVGVSIPDNKQIGVALTYLYGVGLALSRKILKEANIDETRKASSITLDELNKIKERVRSLSIDFRWRDRLGRQIVLNEKQIKIIEWFADHDQITAKEAGEQLPEVSDDTILRNIKDLLKKGVLKKRGVIKNAYYVMRK